MSKIKDAFHDEICNMEDKEPKGNMTADEKLLPCPFCGNDARYIKHDIYWHGVECNKCEGKVDGFDDIEAAATAWNTRQAAQQVRVSDVQAISNISSAIGWLSAFAEKEGKDSRHYHYIGLLKAALAAINGGGK